MKNSKIQFFFHDIYLTLLSQDDLEDTLVWRNHEEHRVKFKYAEPIKIEQHLAFFEKYSSLPNDLIFIIWNSDNVKVGQCALYNIDHHLSKAELGRIVVNPDFSGKGYIKQALMGLLDFAENFLGLKRVHLEVKKDNSRAIGLYQSLAFTVDQEDEGYFQMSVEFN